jgi:hypothetical protein
MLELPHRICHRIVKRPSTPFDQATRELGQDVLRASETPLIYTFGMSLIHTNKRKSVIHQLSNPVFEFLHALFPLIVNRAI